MTITREFKLCLNAGTASAPFINVNQYDEGEEWYFSLYHEDGSSYTPSSGAIIGLKADNNAILNAGSVVAGKVLITETQQMTAAAGRAIYELLIDGETHGTANFIVNVERRPSDDAEFSDSDLSLLQQAVDSAAEIETLLGGQDVPTVITPIISDWLDENITNPSNPPIDTSLTVAGAAADAKKTGDEITDLKSALGDVKTAALGTIDSSTDEWMIRKNNKGLVKKVDLPSSFGSALNIDIFGDGYTFQTAFDVSINKNDSSTLATPIVYCSPTGGGNGTTEDNPTTLDGALNTTYNRNNQTFLLLDGVHCCGYGREIKANINIIAKNKGKAFICGGHATRPSYTVESGNTYKTGVYNVVKAMQLIDNELYSLSSAESLDECKATSGTAYFTNSAVYVHLYNNVIPSADNVLLTRSVADRPTLNIKNTTQNTNVYLEGVVVVGGCPSALYVSNSPTYTSAKISAKDCIFLNSYDTNNGKVCEIRGADAYFQNCVAKFGSFDGFGYTQANSVGCNFIEINCTGAFNGLDGNASGSPYQNGSTAHQNCKGIRLNGRYFNNYGGNVADVQTDCETLNLACVAFDSESDMDGASTDFSAQQAGAIMNLIGCRTFGKSKYNIYAYSGTVMNLTHCRYKNTQGSGTINVLAE